MSLGSRRISYTAQAAAQVWLESQTLDEQGTIIAVVKEEGQSLSNEDCTAHFQLS